MRKERDHAPTVPCPLPAARRQANRFLVLFLTFMCYTAYHASRRPLAIVKSALHGNPPGSAAQDALGALGGGHGEIVWTASNISACPLAF